MSKKVGVIGLGAMGLGVAKSLLRAGFDVHGCDVRQAVLDEFAGLGGVACKSPAQLGSRCKVVLTLVVNAEQTEAALFNAMIDAPRNPLARERVQMQVAMAVLLREEAVLPVRFDDWDAQPWLQAALATR